MICLNVKRTIWKTSDNLKTHLCRKYTFTYTFTFEYTVWKFRRTYVNFIFGYYLVILVNCLLVCFVFVFYQDFLSQQLTTHRKPREGKGPSLIPLYHFHQPTNIQTFICNFVHEMAITYLPPYQITIWLIDDVMLIFVYLLFWF